MLSAFINKAAVRKYPWQAKPRIVICIPCGATSVEKRAVFEAAIQAGARQAYLIEEPMAAAMGADLPVTEPTGSHGGGHRRRHHRRWPSISLGGIVTSSSLRLAGNRMDEAIAMHLRDLLGIKIGERTAEIIKIKIGSILPFEDGRERDMIISGQDVITEQPKEVTIQSEDVRAALVGPCEEMVVHIKETFKKTNPDLASDIIQNGILLTGGGGLLSGLDRYLTDKLEIPVWVSETALTNVVTGCLKVLETPTALKQTLMRSKQGSARHRMALNFQQSGSASAKRVLLVVLLVISLALATLYAREGEDGPLHAVQGAVAVAVGPFKFVGAAAGAGASSVGEGVENLTADESTLSGLRESNEELRRRLAEADEYKQEAERLEGLLDLKRSYDIDGVAARIVGKSVEAYNQTVTLDVGRDDGVESGMTVMGATGVVGQVKSTDARTCEVRLLTDQNSGAAAIIQSNRGEGIVRGSLEGLLYLENVDEANWPVVGDVIVTSGLGGSYVRGLIIGTVVRVDAAAGNATGRIVVKPNDTAASLSEVLVVRGLNSEGALGSTPQAGADGSGAAGGDTAGEDGDGEGGGES